MKSALKTFLGLWMELLRELGDENAYRRHLAAHCAAHSGEEWRRFQNSRLKDRYQRGKCC